MMTEGSALAKSGEGGDREVEVEETVRMALPPLSRVSTLIDM